MSGHEDECADEQPGKIAGTVSTTMETMKCTARHANGNVRSASCPAERNMKQERHRALHRGDGRNPDKPPPGGESRLCARPNRHPVARVAEVLGHHC